jgi:tetratricopeptide (TPR) repeat protein
MKNSYTFTKFILFIIIFSYQFFYCQDAKSFYNSGLNLFYQSNPNSALKALKYFQKAIEKDSSFIEAYFYIGSLYSEPDKIIQNKSKAKGYFKKVIKLLDKGKLLWDNDISEREIYRDIASNYQYELNSPEEVNNYTSAIDLYEKSLTIPFESKKWDIYLDNSNYIEDNIALCYESLGDLSKRKINIDDAINYYNEAINEYQKEYQLFGNYNDNIQIFNIPIDSLKAWNNNSMKYAREINKIREQINAIRNKINILNAFQDAIGWKVITIGNSKENNELISSDNIIYFYDPQTVEHINKNILRVWIKHLKLGKDTLSDNDEYEGRIYYEIDIRNKKLRVLSYATYDKNIKIIISNSPEEPKWDFIIPDTIADDIMNYFKNKKI